MGKITESRVCKLFCVNLAKTRVVLPTTLKQDFKHILDFEFKPSIHKSIKFFLQPEQYNIRRIQNEVNNINSFELYKSFILGTKNVLLNQIIFSKAGLVMKQI